MKIYELSARYDARKNFTARPMLSIMKTGFLSCKAMILLFPVALMAK